MRAYDCGYTLIRIYGRQDMMRTVLILTAVLLASACSNKQPDLLSPCVGAEGSPCERRPVNDWWMKKNAPQTHRSSARSIAA